MDHFTSENIALLRSLDRALEAVDDQLYAAVEQEIFCASIGQHTRHILDHYLSFVSGIKDRRINYDARLRELSIETDKGKAVGRLREIIEQLEVVMSLGDIAGQQALDVVMNIHAETDQERCPGDSQQSSIVRELTFLHSHTIHHLATLSMMFRYWGLETEAEYFGYAPATIRHLRAL